MQQIATVACCCNCCKARGRRWLQPLQHGVVYYLKDKPPCCTVASSRCAVALQIFDRRPSRSLGYLLHLLHLLHLLQLYLLHKVRACLTSVWQRLTCRVVSNQGREYGMSEILFMFAHMFGPFALAVAIFCIIFVIYDHLRGR
jgi:hypothetical protein